MIIEKIKYTDLNGVEHEETCYFHLNKVERLRIGTKYPGGISEWIVKEAAESRIGSVISAIEDIVQQSYGVRNEDGASFIKNPEFTKRFVESEAYSELIVGLMEFDEEGNPTRLSNFLNGVIGNK